MRIEATFGRNSKLPTDAGDATNSTVTSRFGSIASLHHGGSGLGLGIADADRPAKHVVQRHQRPAECEAARGHDQQREEQLAIGALPVHQ